MSSKELTKIKKNDFVERFVEVCSTSEPAEISRLLNISYQAARNYLDGRYPEANVLLTIAEKTSYSLHWLLTGKGEKIADDKENSEDQMFFEKILHASKEGCALAIREAINEGYEPMPPKTVILKETRVKREKSREVITSTDFSDE